MLRRLVFSGSACLVQSRPLLKNVANLVIRRNISDFQVTLPLGTPVVNQTLDV
ncbi:unnamed protein product, partial [Nippostrongylus brasiliensis]|uniref:NADH dehydrogenase [ubiquinone] 1 alpha subcomplex subunit 9, mitochondrial n=1 Tax=Nippostrongylus brasiliensis TaxID=27835 RepID=A0A0N4XE59_NIPBR